MTDRQPGAPGQYKAIIEAAELMKMQSGEQFVITLSRDDQPIVEGTPYNKASVLPDELAAVICPGVLDPTPADAFRGVAAQRWTVSLAPADWNGDEAPYTQTVSIDGILKSDTPHVTMIGSGELENKIEQMDAWSMVSTGETVDGAIVFTCFEDKPEIELNIQIEVNR